MGVGGGGEGWRLFTLLSPVNSFPKNLTMLDLLICAASWGGQLGELLFYTRRNKVKGQGGWGREGGGVLETRPSVCQSVRNTFCLGDVF